MKIRAFRTAGFSLVNLENFGRGGTFNIFGAGQTVGGQNPATLNREP